jgi:hypothetical protein
VIRRQDFEEVDDDVRGIALALNQPRPAVLTGDTGDLESRVLRFNRWATLSRLSLSTAFVEGGGRGEWINICSRSSTRPVVLTGDTGDLESRVLRFNR